MDKQHKPGKISIFELGVNCPFKDSDRTVIYKNKAWSYIYLCSCVSWFMFVFISCFSLPPPCDCLRCPDVFHLCQLYCVFNNVDDGILVLTGKTSKNHSVSDLLCNCCTSLNSFKRDLSVVVQTVHTLSNTRRNLILYVEMSVGYAWVLHNTGS